MVRARDAALVAIGMLGCVALDTQAPPRAYIAPLDGQTNVSTDARLLVRTGSFRVPPGYPLPDLIQVTDITDESSIPGIIELSDEAVVFTPSGGWTKNRRYAWTVPQPETMPHGPNLDLPSHLVGTAVFDTSNDLYMLGATWEGLTDELCLIFSRRVSADDQGALRVSIDDIEIDETMIRLLPPEQWSLPWELFEEDEGIDVLCVDTLADLSTGSSVQVWWGDIGPWYADIFQGPISDYVLLLRRGNW